MANATLSGVQECGCWAASYIILLNFWITWSSL